MFANIGPWQLLIILVIVLAIFGTKKLSSLGSDLGKSVKGFRSAMNEADEAADQLRLWRQDHPPLGGVQAESASVAEKERSV